MHKRSLIWLSIGIATFLIVLLGWMKWNKPFNDPLQGNAVSVTAVQMFHDFSTNENAAQIKYVPEKVDSKPVEVTGEIKDTGQNADGEKYYVLNGDDKMFGVKCIMNNNGIANARPGDKVTVRGFCTGYNMDVILNRCQLVK